MGKTETLRLFAEEIRVAALRAFQSRGFGHVGGAMSIVEILAVLYGDVMRIDPQNPDWPGRDRLVLSKGHAGTALYAALALRGYFPEAELLTLNRPGTRLPSHCDRTKTPGVDMTTGSLGQGISAAIGIALANRLDGIDKKTFLIIGDGESQEGQVWEGAMSAPHFRLSNLIAFTDYNKMQIDGYTQEIMNIEDITAKWLAFGWFVQRCNGHDFQAMSIAVDRALKETQRPSMIVLDTIKGKGADFAEGRLDAHNMTFDYATARAACEKLNKC